MENRITTVTVCNWYDYLTNSPLSKAIYLNFLKTNNNYKTHGTYCNNLCVCVLDRIFVLYVNKQNDTPPPSKQKQKLKKNKKRNASCNGLCIH